MSASSKGRNLRLAAVGVATLAVSMAVGWALKGSAVSQQGPRSSRDAAGDRPAREAVTPVEAVRVRRSDLSLRAEATGYLEPWRRVEIKAEGSGRVVEEAVENGLWVAAGTVLVQLDDRDRRIELEEAEAEWLKARALYAVNYEGAGAETRPTPGAGAAADEAERAEKLLAEGVISRQAAEELRERALSGRLLAGGRRDEVRSASAGLSQAEKRVERARLAFERTRIVAPFAGRLADSAVEIGQQIGPGDKLVTLLEDARVRVDVNVLEADVVRLRPGAPARVRIPSLDNLVLEGTIHAINPRLNPSTGTGQVTIAIPNQGRLLLTGLFANVELETRRLTGRLVVPASALLTRQGRDLAFRIRDGRALWTYVTVGTRAGDQVEITDGLEEGDIVATGGHFALAHEAPVEVRRVDTPAVPAR